MERLNLRLLSEVALSGSNFEQYYKKIIIPIIENGWLEDWRDMVIIFRHEKILEAIEWNAQLSKRNREFARFFLASDMLHPENSHTSHRLPRWSSSTLKKLINS